MSALELPVRLLGPFSDEPHPSTPKIDIGEPSVVLAATQLEWLHAAARCTLHVALGFEAEFFHAFKHINRAVVVTIEEPSTRRSTAIRLHDESIRFLDPHWPNFEGYDWDGEPSIVFSGLAINVPIEIDAHPTGAGLWLQASVLCHRSNRVHLAVPRELPEAT